MKLYSVRQRDTKDEYKRVQTEMEGKRRMYICTYMTERERERVQAQTNACKYVYILPIEDRFCRPAPAAVVWVATRRRVEWVAEGKSADSLGGQFKNQY